MTHVSAGTFVEFIVLQAMDTRKPSYQDLKEDQPLTVAGTAGARTAVD